MRAIVIAAVTLGFFTPARGIAASGHEVALSLRQNVVRIVAEWENGETHHGFAFLVGDRGTFAYYVTADHTVRGDIPGEFAREVSLTHFGETDQQTARVLPHHDIGFDLAVLRAPIPVPSLWRRDALSNTRELESAAPVWFVGRNAEWFLPASSGTIEKAGLDRIITHGLPIRVGTSGAPLIDHDGIVGMIVMDDGRNSHATPIEAIRRSMLKWGYPWTVGGRKSEVDLSGQWRYFEDDEESGLVTFTRTDLVRYQIVLRKPQSPAGTEGVAVLDGLDLRFTGQSDFWRGQSALLTVESVLNEESGAIGLKIVGEGYSSGDDDLYDIKLIRFDPDGQINARVERARAKASFDQKDWTPEALTKKLGVELPSVPPDSRGGWAGRYLEELKLNESRIDAEDEDEPEVDIPDSALLPLMRQVLRGSDGLERVTMTIEQECIQTEGPVPTRHHQELVRLLIWSFTHDLPQRSRIPRRHCDMTIVQ